MKPTPLLEFWQKPPGAGEPVAMIASTFALEPDFFERDCLARFLEVSSVDEDTGSIDDIVASIELHELLQEATVTVLADRSAQVDRTSLLWDLLSCNVDGGLLHAKVAVLMWENATRVILGSANLTSAGYRRQLELGLAADLGPGCIFPPGVLTGIADELRSYVTIIPGYDPRLAVFERATGTLDLFAERIAEQPAARSKVRVAFAPTNATTRPLDQLGAAWNGPTPLWATHLSPFWDSHDPTALTTVRKLLTGRPADRRSQHVAVVLGPRGETSFSQFLAEHVDSVQELKRLDPELRLLHAKCLLIESEQWVAALVGSSNHTRAGLGLSARRHREMNVWLGASEGSREGKALRELVELGALVSADADEIEPSDEDEADLPDLPTCFGLCQVARRSSNASWELRLGITTVGMPKEWSIGLTVDEPLLTRRQWQEGGSLPTTTVPVGQEALPMFVVVQWDDRPTPCPWAVIADDRLELPPGPRLAGLRAQHLLDALATGRSLGEILREELEGSEAVAEACGEISPDPLKRLDIRDSLLRRGRALAKSLNAMEHRLERQVITLETLRARLAGPLGPEFVATKVLEAYTAGEQSSADAAFTIAEIALSVGRVDWSHVLEYVDTALGESLIAETLNRLDMLRKQVNNAPSDLASYAGRAIIEARRCLTS